MTLELRIRMEQKEQKSFGRLMRNEGLEKSTFKIHAKSKRGSVKQRLTY